MKKNSDEKLALLTVKNLQCLRVYVCVCVCVCINLVYDKEYFRLTRKIDYSANHIGVTGLPFEGNVKLNLFHLSHQSKFQLNHKFQYKKEKKILVKLIDLHF